MTTFNIRIVSDVICPWCYIGAKRLNKAVEVYKKTVPGGVNDVFAITWHPFYLDPSLPRDGVDRLKLMASKFGAERARMATARISEVGAAEGIAFSFNGLVGNTRDAHRLIQLAKTKSNEVENEVMASLFKLHFENDADVTSHEALVKAGVKGGLDGDEVREWLKTGKGGDQVDREVEEAYRSGVHGVPNFLVNEKYQIEGAQDAEVLASLFARVKAGTLANSAEVRGPAC